MRIDILTLFPEMCERILDESIIGQARRRGNLEVYCHNFRDYSDDIHRKVDDYPYGGGNGMLLRAEPIARCFEQLCKSISKRPYFIYTSPKGRVFNQSVAIEYSGLNNLAILCGHYEGIDERFIEEFIDEQISIGDFVLTGGELPALVITDAVARMLPGVLSDEQCFTEESHYNGLLEYPQYTRPPVWRGKKVPDVLLSGHQKNIQTWQRQRSLDITADLRPDILQNANLDKSDILYLKQIASPK